MTTVYELDGVSSDADTKKVKSKVYDVDGVGAVAFEITPEQTLMFLKHKEDVVLDSTAIGQAVASAGEFRVLREERDYS
ncbi:hypothetical protein GWK18_12505 [Kocuria sp. JC486]|uniref:hypothetical protein n=1 Tax=Kocuria sp. JC486 TaxID=1970736 RepID=UPI0014209A8B|nr:hypothetical protein [Kocuria sp. JC486]NHU86380.1 hypothetical protein [Kocuria sp. JC486]